MKKGHNKKIVNQCLIIKSTLKSDDFIGSISNQFNYKNLFINHLNEIIDYALKNERIGVISGAINSLLSWTYCVRSKDLKNALNDLLTLKEGLYA